MQTKLITLILALSLHLTVLHGETAKPASLDQRLITLTSSTANAEDHSYLETLSKENSPSACVAIALLFKHWPEQHREQFIAYYRIAPDAPLTLLPEDEINERVNAMLRDYQGLQPLDVSSRIYMAFRQQGYAVKRTNGNVLKLEAIFRGAVFTGITGGEIKEVHRFSAVADGKSLPAVD